MIIHDVNSVNSYRSISYLFYGLCVWSSPVKFVKKIRSITRRWEELNKFGLVI